MNAKVDFFCLNADFSTTRIVSSSPPDGNAIANENFHSSLYLKPNQFRKGEGGLRVKWYYKKSRPDKKLVTIITVIFNGESYLEQTILSVINQSYDNVEYIVIDAGSTDNTINIIKRYEDCIDYWVSEKDNGIYDAMNKGISLASGVITNLLNADDYYNDEQVIANVLSQVNGCKNSIFVGDTLLVGERSSNVFHCKEKVKALYYQIPFMHPSCFIPIEVYQQAGLYSLSYRIASDVDFLMRIIYAGTLITHLPFTAVAMRQGGLSNSSYIRGRKEYAKIYLKHSGNVIGMLYGLIKSILFYYLAKFKRLHFFG